MLIEGFEPIPGYRLQNFLGRGQFGEVWKATSPGGTYIALKFLNVRERQGRKEFRAIQKVKGIRYPHLVQTYALWLLDENMQVIDDAAFDSNHSILNDSVRATMIRQPVLNTDSQKPSMLVIATVLCDQNLMERLLECKQNGQRGIPATELIGYIEDAAKAIDFLNAPRHELGDGPVAIHHCDIKPENIMILGDLAVVGDFGVARILRSGSDSRATTMGGSVAYAAPESYDNRTEATSDQYSLAITYYELRTGKLPFPEDSQSQVMRDKLAGHLYFNEVTPLEAKVLQRATSVVPGKRFPTARLFVEALREAVCGKKMEPRPAGWGMVLLGTVAMILSVAGILVYLRPINKFEKENPPEIDGATLYAETLQKFRLSDRGFESTSQAIEKTSIAIKGGYRPESASTVGIEPSPIFQTDLDSLDEKHCLRLISLSPDQQTLVKAVQNTLHFSSLLDSQTRQIELQNVGVIEQLVWLPGEIVLLDQMNRLIRIEEMNGVPQQDRVATIDIVLSSGGSELNNWLGMGLSTDRSQLLLLNGKESESHGLFVQKPGKFQVLKFAQEGMVSPIKIGQELRWKDQRPKVIGDSQGKFFLLTANYDGEIGTQVILDVASQRGVSLLNSAAIQDLKEIRDVAFIDSNGAFFMTGISKNTDEDYRILFGDFNDQDWEIKSVTLLNAQSIGAMTIESPNSVLLGQSTKLLRCNRETLTNDWEALEVLDFEDGLLTNDAAMEGATGRINAICKLNDRWIMTGHETGKSMLVSHETGSEPIGFAICPKLESAIQDIKLTRDRVVIITQDGGVIWYDLAEILLMAESCKKAGIFPRMPTKSISVRS